MCVHIHVYVYILSCIHTLVHTVSRVLGGFLSIYLYVYMCTCICNVKSFPNGDKNCFKNISTNRLINTSSRVTSSFTKYLSIVWS